MADLLMVLGGIVVGEEIRLRFEVVINSRKLGGLVWSQAENRLARSRLARTNEGLPYGRGRLS
jgi:hypothetical protein